VDGKTPRRAFAIAKLIAKKGGAIVVCGSIYSFSHLLGLPGLAVSQ
jgi:hypothetical protein